MYAKISDKTKKLKQFHHVSLDAEFRSDATIWLSFLRQAEILPGTLCRPFVDLSLKLVANEVDLFTDSSASQILGFGGIFMMRWFFGKWEAGFIRDQKPSIQYLELHAVCMAIFIWIQYFENYRLILHCDNDAVVRMINTSGCEHCMKLLRKLMVKSLQHNTRIFAVHVASSDNGLSDSLSRLQFRRFFRLAKIAGKRMNVLPDVLSPELWPLTKIWQS